MSNKEFNSQDQHLLQPEVIDDEITLKDIIRELKSWKQLFLYNFKKIMLVGLLGGMIGFAYAYFSQPIYTAKLTFVMRADAGVSAASGLAGLSSLLGGGTSAASVSPLDRIVELIGSDRIVGEALLTETIIGGKKDLLINHIIRIKRFNESSDWKEDSVLSKVIYSSPIDYDELTKAQRKAIIIVSNYIVGKKGVLTKGFEKKSGVISIFVSDTNEELAIMLSKQVYDQLVKFYTNESVASISSKVSILKAKVDSIQFALNYTQRASAASSDQGLGLLLQQDRVDQKRLGLKENVLTLMYGEAVKNLEQLEFILATTSPSFSVIDKPFLPIKPEKKSKIFFGFGFSFLFELFYFFFLLGKIKLSKHFD